MTAWQRLLAASSLAIGTAWELLTHPKLGGSGVVVNTGIVTLIPSAALDVALATQTTVVAVGAQALNVTVAEPRISVTISDPRINTILDVA